MLPTNFRFISTSSRMTHPNIPTAHKLALFKSAFGKSLPPPPDKHDALFHSVRAALAFAYSISEFPIASSPKLGLPTGGSGRLSGFSPQEKHAQGALIRRAAEQRLQGRHLSMLFADHGFGRVRATAIQSVCWEVATIARNASLGHAIATRLFSRNGVCEGQQEISRRFSCAQSTVCRLEGKIAEEVGKLRSETEAKLEAMFVATGVAEGV